ncbi:hypothetical protein [uncultured Flavobacterium sp.]|uniref:hypothetical protein n=1 Tax=uncultured Flavobacterium sp. TaxID=165435 RepID=UPI002931D8B8|nr:hypothetical protein [uncultured Flavobacterium sp.]
MRKITKLFKGLLLLSLVLLMTNCATEEIGQKNVTQSSTEAKIWFDSHQKDYNATVLNYIGDLQWQNAITSEGDMGEIIEVPFTLTSGLAASTNEADQYNDHHRLMFVKDGQNEFKLSYIQIFANDENYNVQDKNYNYYNIKDNFDGNIYVQELATNIRRKIEFKEGQKIAPSLTAKMREMACLYYGYWGGDGRFNPLYEVACYSGGPTGDSAENPQPSYGGGGGSSTSPNTSQTLAQKIKNISSDKLDACTKAILEKLKNLNQGDLVTMIQRFNPSGSIFNINMSTGQVLNNDPNIWAQTKPVSGSSTDISMVFNQDYINGNGNPNPPTDLSVANTMVHEIIHAYLISQLEEYKSCGASGICDFPTIYDAYVQQQINKDKSKVLTADRHHELIASDYVNAIASSVEEFHTGQPVTSGFPRQEYLDLAWGGLQGTYIFNKTYPNDPSNKNYKDRERILARITAEQKGSQYGITTPIGTPCKN